MKQAEISNISDIFSIYVKSSIKSTKSNNKATSSFSNVIHVNEYVQATSDE